MIPSEVNVVLKDIWRMLLLFSIVLFTIRIFDIIVNKKEFVLYKDLITFTFLLYLFLLFELVTSTDFESYSNNFIPFKEIMRYNYTSKLFYKNVVGNMLLFIPFGYFVNNILKNKKVIVCIIVTLITSLSIEMIQMNIGRSFDIDDIILNILGGLGGYFIYRIKEYIKNILPECLKRNWIYNILWILLLVCSSLFLLNYYGVINI